MGSRRLDLRSAPLNYHQAVASIFKAAFGPSPALYRQVSLCGWRPLCDHRKTEIYANESEGNHNTATILPSPASGIEIYETPEGMTVEVALSTIDEESLHLAIAGKMLIIRGERIQKDQTSNTLIFDENFRPYFQHLIEIPTSVNAGGFRVQLKGDVVQIEFAKCR